MLIYVIHPRGLEKLHLYNLERGFHLKGLLNIQDLYIFPPAGISFAKRISQCLLGKHAYKISNGKNCSLLWCLFFAIDQHLWFPYNNPILSLPKGPFGLLTSWWQGDLSSTTALSTNKIHNQKFDLVSKDFQKIPT